MQIKVMKQELDTSEQQKLTMFQHIQKLQSQNTKVKDSFKGLVEHIQSKRDAYRDIIQDEIAYNNYDRLL